MVNGTIARHMARTPADTTDDVGSEVALFRAVVLAMSNTTAVLADLVLIVSEGSVKSCQLAQLITLMIILAFGGRSGLCKG